MTHAETIKALTEVVAAFEDVVKVAGPMGMPAGHMYARVMDRLSLEQFEAFMSVLVKAGRVVQSNHCYYHSSIVSN